MSARFAMAVHTLALLAQDPDGYPSDYIAGSVNTHAVFLRRILKTLADAGLVEAREGRGGGYRLARPAAKLTLADVYTALGEEGPLTPSPAEPNPHCPVGSGMRRAFEQVEAKAKSALLESLAAQTVADVGRAATARKKTR